MLKNTGTNFVIVPSGSCHFLCTLVVKADGKKEERRAYQRDYYRRKCARRDSNNQTHADPGNSRFPPFFRLLCCIF